MTLVKWTPFRELLDMPHEMRSMFGRPFVSLLEEPLPGLDTVKLGAPMDVFAKGKDMIVRLELPGIEVDDIEITLCEGTLSICGERRSDKEVKEDDFYRRERSYGRFERSLLVPEKATEKDNYSAVAVVKSGSKASRFYFLLSRGSSVAESSMNTSLKCSSVTMPSSLPSSITGTAFTLVSFIMS